MDFRHFIGIDFAKDSLDWAVYTQQQGIILSMHTDNTLKGIKEALTQLKILPNWNSSQTVFCMEHTATADHGHLQCSHLLELLYESRLSIWLASSLQIKQAGGMQRGKTDKVDAQRIAQYAYGTGHPAVPRSDTAMATTSGNDAKTGFAKCDSSTAQSGRSAL